MSPKYTFLFVPLDAAGHVYPCIGIAEKLLARGHKIIFATPNEWKGKISPFGFTEECYSTHPPPPEEPETDDGQTFDDKFGAIVAQMAPALAMSPEDQLGTLIVGFFQEVYRQIKFAEPIWKEMVERVKPDVIISDLSLLHSPALFDAGIPWICSIPLNPVGINTKNLPPAFSGYSMKGDKSKWEEFYALAQEKFGQLFEDGKKWVIENGGPELKFTWPYFINYSPYANMYMCPKELVYEEYRPNLPNWHRFDSFIREDKQEFQIPEKLKNLPGKLIYFSMGSIGCCELNLMLKLVGILAKSPHRFIVSKGPLESKIPLADNMWGAKSVPQTRVLPLVDMYITHGGNNSLTEAFYFGKRCIVLPLFADQHDNAQRVEDTGLGLQFLPYKVTETELLAGIETLLDDKVLESKMKAISKRSQAELERFSPADLIESVAMNNVVK